MADSDSLPYRSPSASLSVSEDLLTDTLTGSNTNDLFDLFEMESHITTADMAVQITPLETSQDWPQ